LYPVNDLTLDLGEDEEQTVAGVATVFGRRLGLWSALFGGLAAVLGVIPLAALVVLVVRTLFPFYRITGDPEPVILSLFEVFPYPLGGGIILLAVLGALGGLLAHWIGKQDAKRTLRLTLAFAVLMDVLAALALALFLKCYILVGLAAGCLTGYLMKGGRFGVLGDIAVGAIGALVGVLIFHRLIGSVIGATIGAVLLSFLLRLFRRPVNENGVIAGPTMHLGVRSAILGGLVAVLGVFPVAPLFNLVFRIPLGWGSDTAPGALFYGAFVVLVYGCMGGFLLLAILGALGGLLAYRIGKRHGKLVLFLTVVFALLADVLATLTVAFYDKIWALVVGV
jgi:uncharacterized membrane protein YeaQ/YmgE (transglycosylase-associated protein family)